MDCSQLEQLDPRVRRTRKLLQDALRSLIQEKSFSAITVQDIAERATVNRATFYAHYPGKEHLAISLFQADLHGAMIQHFAEPPALTRENLVEWGIVIFEFLGKTHGNCPENGAELQDTVGKTLQDTLYEMVESWLSRSPSYRRLFPDCTKETVATVLSWSIYGAALRWSRSSQSVPARQVCQEIVSMLMPESFVKMPV